MCLLLSLLSPSACCPISPAHSIAASEIPSTGRNLNPLRNCPLPDLMPEHLHVLRATVDIAVDETGRPRAATILRDDGYGSGARAVQCAIAARFDPAHDQAGKPIPANVRLKFVFVETSD